MARPCAMLSPGAAETIAVRPSKRLASSARMAGTETIGPAARLADGEFRNRARGGLSFPRQRRTNERPMYRPVVVFAILGVAFLRVFTSSAPDHAIVFRREIGLDFGIVRVLVMFLLSLVARRRRVFDVEIVGVLVG